MDAWSSITTVAESKQGTLLVLSLPESGKHGDLKGKVIDECAYGGVDSLKNVKAFLKLHTGQNSVSEVVDKIKTFMNATRKPDQTIQKYVSNFDSSYSLAKTKANMAELPPVFLMWVLIKNANISEHDKKLVLSGVDLYKADKMYEDTKKALLKYCGNDSSSSCLVGAAVGPNLDPESIFFTGRGRGLNRLRGRGNPRPRGDDQNFDPDRYHPKFERSNLDLDGKKINAKKNGAVLTCNFCVAFLHLWKDC